MKGTDCTKSGALGPLGLGQHAPKKGKCKSSSVKSFFMQIASDSDNPGQTLPKPLLSFGARMGGWLREEMEKPRSSKSLFQLSFSSSVKTWHDMLRYSPSDCDSISISLLPLTGRFLPPTPPPKGRMSTPAAVLPPPLETGEDVLAI